MKNVVIQKAEANDFPRIQELFRKMFDIFQEDQNIEYPYTEGGINYLKEKISGDSAFVAKVNGKLIGFLTWSINNSIEFKTYEKYGFIENMYIDDEYRKIGVGRMLVNKFVEHCKDIGVDHIQTDSDANQNLINFYTSIGFRITGINYLMKI